MKNRIETIVLIGIPVIIVGIALIFFFNNYKKLDSRITSIEIRLGKPLTSNRPSVYLLDSTDVAFDFKTAFPSYKVDDLTLTIPLGKEIKVRQFRLFFPPATDIITIEEIRLHSRAGGTTLHFDKLKLNEIQRINKEESEKLSIKILSKIEDSFLESSRFYYPGDTPHILVSLVPAVAILLLLVLLIYKTPLHEGWRSITVSEWSVVAVILCTFLPQRYFNISLILSLILVIKNFNIKLFLVNKAHLFLVGFFVLIVISFLLESADDSFQSIEKYTLFLVIPVYLCCIPGKQLIKGFLFSGLTIGGFLLARGVINFSVFKNFEVLSFWNFTGSIHPVYYSYLLALCILYVESHKFKYKYHVQCSLFFLLILSGSKLIIFFIVFLFILFLRGRIILIALAAVVLAMVFFAPIKNRFESVVNVEALSILSEDPIKNSDDPRLNGLTYRVILWQESIKLVKERGILFGLGVTKSGRIALSSSLERRGLIYHLEYNAHNQYVTTLFQMGIVGLLLLMAIIIYCIVWGLKNNNKTLVFYTLLMAIAMVTESIFERSFGIAFFCLSILILMNSDVNGQGIQKKDEYSDSLRKSAS